MRQNLNLCSKQHITVASSSRYLTCPSSFLYNFYYFLYGRIPSKKIHRIAQWPGAAFQPQKVTAAALQIRKARHKSHLFAETLTFGKRAMCGQQQEEAEDKGPSTFCVLISLAPWGLTVFYLRKAVWAFKASSLSKTSKQPYKAEGLTKDTTVNLYLGNRIAAGRWKT